MFYFRLRHVELNTWLKAILGTGEYKFIIPYSEITKVELNKSRGERYHIYITAGKQKTKWHIAKPLHPLTPEPQYIYINPLNLTPIEKKKLDEEYIMLREGLGERHWGKSDKAFKNLIRWTENKILRIAFPENKLHINLPE